MKSTKLARISEALLLLFGMPIVMRSQTIARAKNADPPRYKVVDLGTLGGSFSDAFGVNNRNEVVGFSTVSGDVSLHAFLWQNGLLTDLGILGPPDIPPFSTAVAINDAGEVVGTSETNLPDPFGEKFCVDYLICLPVVWEEGAIRALPTLGGTNGLANDVNESGLVGGSAENNQPDPTCVSPEVFHFEPVLWKNGRSIQLPTIGGDPDGFVLGVNDRGEAVGVTLDCAFGPGGHSVLWRNGKALDMNAPGADPAAEPSDINNQTQIVGTAFYSDGSGLAMLWQNGLTQVIGALPGHIESHANSINNKGQIVGQSCSSAGFPDCSVFLWENGVMIDLNNLVSETSLTLVDSGKINDQGQIVGLALTSDGALHAFLATPDNDASGEMGSTAMIPNPQHRHMVALPAVAQKTLDRRMHPKFRHSGRVRPLDNSR